MPFHLISARQARLFRSAGLSALALLVSAVACAVLASTAQASHTQVSMIEDPGQLLNNPTATLLRFRQLGIEQVRIVLRWQAVAPHPNSFSAPKGFQASNPAAYSASAWAPYDEMISDALNAGIQVNLDVTGGAPIWATGPGMPKQHGYPFHNWDPSAVDFGQFVRAVATRYGGNYDPKAKKIERGNAADLPKVSFWSIWNEPDYGPSLAPQALSGSNSVPEAPRIYRAMVDQAWTALHATGHASDTILIGELAPRGTLTFGVFNGETPLVFLRALYCVNSAYRELRGAAASELGCPTTAAGSAAFAAQNPALFAAGVSDHPYMRWYPPNVEEDSYQPAHFAQILPNYATLATIGNLERALNRLTSLYGSSKVLSIWSTEFGYQTSPPKRKWKNDPYPWVSQATAAYYDNWAEYISWKDPRIASFNQYLLEDTGPATQADDYGGYASGLLDYGGRQKPGYDAFRMPVYLPRTTIADPNQPLQVWGAVKTVHYAMMDDPAAAENVQILFEPAGSKQFSLLQTVAISSPEGYFDVPVLLPSSGTLKLRWTFPDDSLLAANGATVYSRPVQVTVK